MLHSKQWHYSLHRDFQNCYSTRRSPTGFFSSKSSSNSSSNSTRISIHLHPHLHVCTLHYTTENSPSRIQFYMQKTESSSSTTSFQKRNSTHRRQGDLLEIHPCVLQDIPGIPAASPSKGNSSYSSYSSYSNYSRDIPVFPDIPDIPVFPDIPVIPDIPDIPVIHDLPAFPGNSTKSTRSSISTDSTPVQHSPIRMHILQFDWFPQKLH